MTISMASPYEVSIDSVLDMFEYVSEEKRSQEGVSIRMR